MRPAGAPSAIPRILINNAGYVHQARFADLTPADFDRMFAVHVRGVFLMTHAVLPAMLARKAGVIVNMASQLGQIGGVELVHYSAAKAAIIGLTKSLAREVSAQGVRVNAVAPGPINTPLVQGALARMAEGEGGGTAARTLRRAGGGRGRGRLSLLGRGEPVCRSDDRAQFRRRDAMSETVLITGAGIGIGRATAKAFAKAGYRVVVTDILEKEGAAVVAEIAKPAATAEFHKLDVRSTRGRGRARRGRRKEARRHRRHRRQRRHRPQGSARRADRREMGSYLRDRSEGHIPRRRAGACRHEGAPQGRHRRLSSIMGVAYGWDEHVHYSSAKAGVVGLVRGLAVELARDGVRVNGVAPGYIRTAQLLSEEHSLGPAGAEKAGEFIPMGRIGEPEEIADVILFLASNAPDT